MEKNEKLKQIAENLEVRWVSRGTWEIKSYVWYRDDTGDHRFKMETVTHNEDDNTGIFDGKVYNSTAGFGTAEELNAAAQECGMTVEEYLNEIWSDYANEDNYEPSEERYMRLAERLYDICEDSLENLNII